MSDGTFVLVVEDNPGNRILTIRQLEILGYEARAVAGGAEAIDVVRETLPRLILMDCNMPGMDGMETCRALKTLPGVGSVPILAVTADTHATTASALLAAGVNEVILRPVLIEDLKAALKKWADPSPSAPSGAEPVAGDVMLARLRSEVDEGTVQIVVSLYLDRFDARLAATANAIASDDPVALGDAAHSMRSATTVFDAEEVLGTCAALESLGASGSLEGAAALFGELEAATRDLRVILEGELRPDQPEPGSTIR